MAKTRKPKIYINDTYNQEFLLLIDWSLEEVSAFRKKLGFTPGGLGSAGGATFSLGEADSSIAIWIAPNKNVANYAATVAHEALHAANICLNSRGVYVTATQDEALAYLVGVIVLKIMEHK